MKKTAAPFGIPIPEAAQVFYRTAGEDSLFLNSSAYIGIQELIINNSIA